MAPLPLAIKLFSQDPLVKFCMLRPPAARACILHLSALSSPSSANKFTSASPHSGPYSFMPFASVSKVLTLLWYSSTAPSVITFKPSSSPPFTFT